MPIPSVLAGMMSTLVAAGLAAQSPFSLPYNSNNGGALGGALYFDLWVKQDLAITLIEANFAQPPTTAGTIDVYTMPFSHFWSAGPASWTQVGTATAVAAGVDQPSPVTLAAPIVLREGHYGVAFVCGPTLSHRYSNANWISPFIPYVELMYALGSATNVPFSGTVFHPRAFNGSIHFQTVAPAPRPPFAESYGAGCPVSQPLTLQASAPPLPGTTIGLTTSDIPSGTVIGATVLSTQLTFGHIYYGMPPLPGMTGCREFTPIDVVALFVPGGTSHTFAFAAPSGTAFAGFAVYAQSVTFSPGINPLGIVASNGIALGL